MGRKLCTITFEEEDILTAEDYQKKQIDLSDLKTRVVCHGKLTKYGMKVKFDAIKELRKLLDNEKQ